MSSKTLRFKRKEELRKRNLGVGIGKIDITTDAPVNKKITFSDDFVASDYESDENDIQKGDEHDPNDSEEEESDDEVEQVSASTAKKEALELRAAERKTRKEELALSHKRKRKTKEIPVMKAPESDSDDDDIDDAMLEEIDSERKEESRLKKMKKNANAPNVKRGKHTTFVSENDDPTIAGSMTKPISSDHNIDIVVLPELNSEQANSGGMFPVAREKHNLSLSSSLGTKPSETALLFCRGSQALRNEISEPSEEGFEVKRSRKMKFGLSRGRPLASFGTKKRR